MIDFFIVLIASLLSMIVAYVTSRWTYSNEIGKNLYEKRQNLYLEVFELLYSVKIDNIRMIDEKLYLELEKIYPRVIMFSSSEFKKKFQIFLDNLKESYKAYSDKFLSKEFIKNQTNLIEYKREQENISREEAERLIEEEAENQRYEFLSEEFIRSDNFEKFILEITEIMRSDLKNKIKF